MNTIRKVIALIQLPPFAAILALLVLFPTQAHALKSSVKMTPDSLQESGFTLKLENRKDGTVEFILTRDLSKARSFGPASDLEIRRSATLEVFGKSGLLARCDVEANKQKEVLTYHFVIARDCVPDSHFQLAEIDDYKDRAREHHIGGGTLYEFRLALFAEHSARDKAPE